jgi:hypothetical protein
MLRLGNCVPPPRASPKLSGVLSYHDLSVLPGLEYP